MRRAHERPDRRLLIDDSKKVYTRGGLEALERGVWAIAAAEAPGTPALIPSGTLPSMVKVSRPWPR